MEIINYKLREKATYFIISLLILFYIFFAANSYADNKSDIADLEKFYHQVFSSKSSKKTPIFRKKTSKPSKPKSLKVKDPELVAFYNRVFANEVVTPKTKKARQSNHREKNRKQSHSVRKTIDKNRNLVSPKRSTPQKMLNTTKNVKKVVSTPKQTSINTKKNFKSLEKAPLVNDQTNSDLVAEKPNINNENVQFIENSESSSQSSAVKKTDTAALFEQAFGKKKAKTKEEPVTSKKSVNSNDMASLFAKAFGKKAVISTPSEVTVDFRVNASTLGEIKLFSNSSGPIDSADTETLLKLLEEVLKKPVFNKIKNQLEKKKKTLFSDLNKLEISAFYNSTNLSLDVDIKPEFRKPQILSLLRKQKAFVREENRVEAQKISGFLNAFSNIGLNSKDSEARLRMRLEGSLNIDGIVLETTGNYSDEKFDLGRTTLTYDIPEKLQRFALGNISTGSRNFQENLELDGIRISKEFYLDPDLQISPRANESLQLDSDSEVELYINKQLLRRFYLKKGVYSLQDIGLYNGANNIQIRIKDEFGKITVKSSEQYYDSHLLKPGLSLFAISVGYLSNKQSYSNDSLINTPILSGYYQKGVRKDLTLGFDAQLSSDNFLLGAESINSLSLGTIKNSFAVSGGKDRNTGFATSFEFKPSRKQEKISLDTFRQDLLSLETRNKSFVSSWSVTGEYRSEDFLLLNGENLNLAGTSQGVNGVTFSNHVFNDNKLRGNLQTNFNLNINEKWQGNLNIGVADYYDADESYYANLSAIKRFDNGVRLSVGSRYDTKDEFSMNLQLSIPLSRKKGRKRVDLDVLADSRDNAYETRLSLKPTSFIGKNSLGGSLEHFEDKESRQQNLDIQYRNSLFESTFSARNRYNKNSKNSSQELNLGLNTSIACAGDSCASSYPLNNSFAIVTGPSNQTTPIALSNNNLRFKYSEGNDTGLPDNYTGLISGKGKKAVVLLDSYRTQNINIDEGTLPNGYDSEKTEFSMFPQNRQGFLLKAGGEPATTLDGMLLDDRNIALSFKGGQWIPEKEGKTVAFFSNKAGKFRIMSMPAGKYKLELFDYPDMEPILISVPDTKGKTHDTGNIIIKTPN